MLKTALRRLVDQRLRLLLSAFAVVLGTGFMAATFIVGDTVRGGIDDVTAATDDHTDVEVRGVPAFSGEEGADALREPIDTSIVEEVRAVDGVAEAVGYVEGYAEPADDDGGRFAATIGASSDGIGSVSPFELRSGNLPTRGNEVLLDVDAAKDRNLEIGDQLRILFTGAAKDFTLVGTVGYGSADSVPGATFSLFPLETAQHVLDRVGQIDSVLVVAADGVSTDQLVDRLGAALPDTVEVATSAERVEELSDQAQSSASIIDQMLTAFAGVALFVGGFVVFNTFTMMVAQRTRELALLRALGASRRQIRRAVLIEAVAIGFIGSVVGIVVGVLLAFVILALMNSLGFDLPDTGLVFGVRAVFVPLLIGVVVTVVASYLPARRASAVPPVAAMRDVQTPSRSPRRRYVAGVILLLLGLVAGIVGAPLLLIGVVLLAPLVVQFLGRTVGAVAHRFGGFSGRLGQENAVRDPRRTASTASALMVGLAFVVAMTVMFNSALASFTNALDDSVKADVIVDSGDQGITPEVARKLSSRTKLGVVSPQRYGEFELVGEGTEFLSAVDPETFSETLDVDVTEGSIEDLAGGGVVVSEQRAEDDGLAMGDVLEMRFARTGVRKLPIVGIYADDALYSEGFLVGLDTYVANFTDQRDTRVLINGAEGVSTEETLATVKEVTAEFPNVDVNDQSGYKAAITKEVDQLLAVAAGLLGLAVLIALLGVVNTLTLSIVERTRELGLLRAVGMSRGQLRAMITWESMIIAVIGGLLGLVTGMQLGRSVVAALGDAIPDLAFPWFRLFLFLVFAIVAGVAAAFWPARRASHLDVLGAVVHE